MFATLARGRGGVLRHLRGGTSAANRKFCDEGSYNPFITDKIKKPVRRKQEPAKRTGDLVEEEHTLEGTVGEEEYFYKQDRKLIRRLRNEIQERNRASQNHPEDMTQGYEKPPEE